MSSCSRSDWVGDWSVDVDCVEFKALASYTLLLLQVISYIGYKAPQNVTG